MSPPSIRDVFGIERELETLRAGIRGEILLPEDEQYDVVRAVWNGMIDRRPAVIVHPTGTADVVAAVNFAREHDLEVAIHGGGHNVSGNAVTDGGLMIDLSAMNGVHVDRQNGTVHVGGGATLGDVDHETQLFGLATPLGVVSATGVGGFTLNGGYGYLSRQYGLACDNLVSVEIVTADGQVRTASAEENEDLFWAVRGGGGNFGVVTSFEYELHEVGHEVYGVFEVYHADDARAMAERFREWAPDAPREVGLILSFAHVPAVEEFPEAHWGDPALILVGEVRGDEETAADVLAPLRGDATPIASFSGPMAHEDVQRLFDADYPDGMRYYWKSTFLTELADDAIDIALRSLEDAPSALSTIDLWFLGGAVADVEQDATAFWHRDKPYMLNFEANWEAPADDDANAAWVREWFEETEALSVAGGRYGNFPGFAEDPAHMLFGENYDRLVEVKTTYDPENRFHLNQNIAPAAGSD